MQTSIIFEGLSSRCSTGSIFSTFQELTRLRKDQIGRIDVSYKRASAELLNVEKEDVIRCLKDLESCCIQGNTPLVWTAMVLQEDDRAWGNQLLKWIQFECEEERQENARAREKCNEAELCKAGLMMGGLHLEDWEVAASGHLLCHLEFHGESPWRKGMPISLQYSNEENCDGLIINITKNVVSVMLNASTELIDHLKGRLSLLKKDSEITHERRCSAIHRALGSVQPSSITLLSAFSGAQEKSNKALHPNPSCESKNTETRKESTTTINLLLSPSQTMAVQMALEVQPLSMIHGPPGTGKSTVLQEIIAQLILQEKKLLICAPSNSAVDHLLQLCLSIPCQKFRWGHPGRVSLNLQDYLFDAVLSSKQDAGLQKAYAKQLRQIKVELAKGNLPRDQYRALKQELRELQQTMQDVELQDRRNVWKDTQMVFSTLTSLDPQQILARDFDVVIIDEAAQCIEPDLWCALPFAQRMILAGDPEQLPAVVRSNKAQGLGKSLMEKLIVCEDTPSVLLQTQYRMHMDIAEFSSQTFYQGQLISDDTVALHQLHDLDGVQLDDPFELPVVFVDSAGSDRNEQQLDGSKFNMGEVDFIHFWLKKLLEGGLSPQQIGIITPYSAQVQQLRKRCNLPELDIQSIDGFQGREKEAILISCVRSNEIGEVGFLSDTRRMNVALTRARRHLCVVGDSSTLCQHPFYDQMLAHFESKGQLRSIFEFEIE